MKHFSCWNQLFAMMFGKLSKRESSRDLIVAFEAHRAKQYHLGVVREPIAKTALASAIQNRNCRIFEDFAFYMMKELVRYEHPTFWIFQERSVLLILRQFHYVSQIHSISLTDKTYLRDLFNKT